VLCKSLDLCEAFASALHLFDDVVCGGVPDEGFWVKVAVVDPGGDGVDQVGDRGEDPSFEAAVGLRFPRKCGGISYKG